MRRSPEPDILLYLPGRAVVAQSDRWSEENFSTSRPIRKALEACGVAPRRVAKMFLEFSRRRSLDGDISHLTEHQGIPIERVFPKRMVIDGEEVLIAKVHYYPGFVDLYGHVTTVFRSTAELIMGKKAESEGGTLKIIPTLARKGRLLPDFDKERQVSVIKGTFVILLPLSQVNVWTHFSEQKGKRPSLIALYSSQPEAYSHAQRRPLDTAG